MFTLPLLERFVIVGFFLVLVILLLIAIRRQKDNSIMRKYLFNWLGWAVHVLGFTIITTLRAMDFLSIDVITLNVWSNVVRLHGGITMMALVIHLLAIDGGVLWSRGS